MTIVKPTAEHLPSYVAALERGWSPNTERDAARLDDLRQIHSDPDAFLASLDDVEAKAGPVILPDGSTVPRLPGYCRWMWDGEFAGTIGLRWSPGTEDLPPTCLGHIGYSVVPWKRRRGYATRALALMLPEARLQGLRYAELVTDADNEASQNVILANGGVLVEQLLKTAQYGGGPALRFRVTL